MIVRISGEDQYRIADDDRSTRLNKLDNDVVTPSSAETSRASRPFAALLDFVRATGDPSATTSWPLRSDPATAGPLAQEATPTSPARA